MELTEEQRQVYLKAKGVNCPKCRSNMLEGQEVEIDMGIARQEVYCKDCDTGWIDIYQLVNVVVAEW